jgi:hypothetical protein
LKYLSWCGAETINWYTNSSVERTKSLTKERAMKRTIFFITIVLSLGVMLSPVQVYAQRNITIVNPSFEKPDSGKIEGFEGKTTHTGSGFKVITVPAWHVDAPDSSVFDSGIEKKTTSDGKYDAFLMSGDSGIFQILGRRVTADDQLELMVDARASYPTNLLLRIAMFYNDGDSLAGTRFYLNDSVVSLPANSMVTYSISVKGSDAPLAVGHKIGILFQNVSPLPKGSWLEMDNVRMINTDQSIIEVPNYSFEQPDSGKIKGWDGPGTCADPAYTGNTTDIPGWTCDDAVMDSGVEMNSDGGEGQYSAFMRWDDSPVWNTTNYSILAGDVITLKVNGRASWLADSIRLDLYYDDGTGNRVTLASKVDTLDPSGKRWNTYSVSFSAADMPASVGKKVGVLLKNASTITNSWGAADFVRLNANHDIIDAVAGTQMNPKKFSLGQNYPNPFNPTTKISFSIPSRAMVTLNIYNILGQEVATPVKSEYSAGDYTIDFNASKLSSGIYFYHIQAGNYSSTKKMILMK